MTAAEQLFGSTDPFIMIDVRFFDYKLKPWVLAVYAHIVFRARNNPLGCFQSKENIAIEIGMGERTVFNALDILSSYNIISEDPQKKKIGYYPTTAVHLNDAADWLPPPQKTIISKQLFRKKDLPQKVSRTTCRMHPAPHADITRSKKLDQKN